MAQKALFGEVSDSFFLPYVCPEPVLANDLSFPKLKPSTKQTAGKRVSFRKRKKAHLMAIVGAK
jgi:hypothetical protein